MRAEGNGLLVLDREFKLDVDTGVHGTSWLPTIGNTAFTGKVLNHSGR